MRIFRLQPFIRLLVTPKLLLIPFAVIFLLAFSFNANAKRLPSIDITGRVTDEKGVPVPGASVFIAGTSKGTTTNSDGRFVMNVPDRNVTLEISNVGFETKRMQVGNGNNITVSLLRSAAGLDDIVVVGYGRVRKRDLTGSVSSVSSRDITSYPAPGALLALQGKTTGVQVLQNSGAPKWQDLKFNYTIQQSSWFAVRINSSSHTNPIFVIVDGKSIIDKKSAVWCRDAVVK